MQKIEKKRILFVTSTFPKSESDTQVPWMGLLVKKLQEKGYDIEVFAPSYKALKSHQYFGIPVYRFRYAPKQLEALTHGDGAIFKLRKHKWAFFLPLLYVLFGSFAIIRLSFSKKYDVIHVHWPLPQTIFGIIAKKMTGAKLLILTFYGAEFTLATKTPFGKNILSFFAEKADKTVVISRYTRDKLKAYSGVSAQIIPFSCTFAAQKGNLYQSQVGKKEILYVGRLIERKGVMYLLDAFEIVQKTTQVTLHIVGEGTYYDRLKNEIKKRHLEKKVFLYGRISEQELKKRYVAASVFVLPAITDRWGETEGLGVVLLEAMNFGKPVVASRVGGITDIVEDNVNGLLVTQKDTNSLAKAIKKILENEALRKKLTTNARKTLEEKFSWKAIIDATEKLYE
ncbi:MAG TPA: glycosyltransferase family 4 protein [Candidatus Saccharimonadales bacterium]|nr:glycosyltransferase family 4 protein [Candidatus Saccharimonadales bacterium]